MPLARREPVERTQAVVIGGGVVGCAVLLELASRGIDAVLLEAEPDVGEGASKANSAIIHTGFDAKPGTIEATLLRRAAERWPSLLETLGVPSLRCGALMLATTADDATRLRAVADLAATHGVATEILDAPALHAVAPYVTPSAVAALDVRDESIVDPFWLTRAYAEAAIALGARVERRSRVIGLDVTPDAVEIEVAGGGRFVADQAFDAAGVRADDVARLAGDDSFALSPRKGQFLVSERTYDVDRIVLPIPGPLGKGMLVTPIVFGGVLLGPTAEDGDDKSDRSTDDAARGRIIEATKRLVPDVEGMDPIRSFAGVRAVSSTGDYIIRPSTAGDRLTIVAGIRSTGISASPAIAEAAVELAAQSRGWTRGIARHRSSAASPELAADAGAVVCVCRSVAAAEVDAALSGPIPPSTTDGLKRRAGVGFGDCQGNRCLADAIDRIAAARGVAPDRVEKGRGGSWIVAANADAVRAAIEERNASPATEPDVVVVGAGLAGIGAALAAADAGLDVCVVERTRRSGGAIAALPSAYMRDDEAAAMRHFDAALDARRIALLAATTVVGLEAIGDGWRVDALSRDGSVSLTARAVVLATGGYLTPREHLAIDGPRPSGVMTADFVLAALDRGWRPGTSAVLVGDGRIPDGTAERLLAAGVRLVARAARVDAIRGETRVEAVLVDADWVDADTLVLAHALRPASFLLRGLGIGDERPGVPMPADARGALPLAGLWAAGTCVQADVDHRSSLAAGRAVGAAVAAALRESSARGEPVGR